MQQVCNRCGKPFKCSPAIVKRGGGKYCSNACKFEAAHRRESVTCEVCRKVFTAKICDIEKGHSKYCSRACNHIALRKGSEHTCEVCGKTFYMQSKRVATGKRSGKYCSQKCYGMGRRKGNTYICQQCGKAFKANKNANLYCSSACSSQHRRDALSSTVVRKMYVEDGLTMPQIARQLNVSVSPVQDRLEWLGIPRRSHSERVILQLQSRFGNSLEKEVATILAQLGMTYQTSKTLERRVFDFFLPDYSTLIECDGTFWHADPRFFPNREGLYEVQKRSVVNDRQKDEIARNKGYRLLRFWEYDVYHNRELIINQLQNLKS